MHMCVVYGVCVCVCVCVSNTYLIGIHYIIDNATTVVVSATVVAKVAVIVIATKLYYVTHYNLL